MHRETKHKNFTAAPACATEAQLQPQRPQARTHRGQSNAPAYLRRNPTSQPVWKSSQLRYTSTSLKRRISLLASRLTDWAFPGESTADRLLVLRTPGRHWSDQARSSGGVKDRRAHAGFDPGWVLCWA